MKKSILQEEKECYITGSKINLHLHHIYPGSNRKISDREGFFIWLRADWHVGQMYSVHENADLMIRLKQECQKKYEETHSREEFIRLIGRNYL